MHIILKVILQFGRSFQTWSQNYAILIQILPHVQRKIVEAWEKKKSENGR